MHPFLHEQRQPAPDQLHERTLFLRAPLGKSAGGTKARNELAYKRSLPSLNPAKF